MIMMIEHVSGRKLKNSTSVRDSVCHLQTRRSAAAMRATSVLYSSVSSRRGCAASVRAGAPIRPAARYAAPSAAECGIAAVLTVSKPIRTCNGDKCNKKAELYTK